MTIAAGQTVLSGSPRAGRSTITRVGLRCVTPNTDRPLVCGVWPNGSRTPRRPFAASGRRGARRKAVFDIVGFAVIAFLIVQFVRGLTLSRTDRAGEGPNS